MKSLIIHFLIAAITFFAGVTVDLVSTASPPIKPVSKLQTLESVTLEAKQPTRDSSQDQTYPDFEFDYDPKEFNPRGTYFMLGRKPKDFREFDSFTLSEVADGPFVSGDVDFNTDSSQTSGVP